MNQVMRKEKKFLLHMDEFYRMKAQVGEVLHGDPHNGPLGYAVRSLYFDSLYDRDFFEKVDGLETRRKIRLRCYSPDADFAMLEMKQKQGDFQKKRSLIVSRDDAVRLSKGDYTPLMRRVDPYAVTDDEDSFALECYGIMNQFCYRPKTVIEYKRLAYIAKENKTRITFDSSVCATECCMDLFSPSLIMNTVLDLSLVVMEVKYNGFLLSYIKQALNAADRSELSVSKYYLARQASYLAQM